MCLHSSSHARPHGAPAHAAWLTHERSSTPALAPTTRHAPARRALVVGSRGLLGAAVLRRLEASGWAVDTVRVPWGDPERAVEALAAATRRLVAPGDGWALLWCAGAGVVGSTPEALGAEVHTLRRFLDDVTPDLAAHPGGTVFLASSAGGLHAGSGAGPSTEDTPPRPLAPYGEAKLEAEGLVAALAARTGCVAVLGRIANLYGPGQDVAKPQGLVSQLLLAQLERRPSSIYVSLDTARDYVFVDDAARLVVAAVAVARERVAPGGTQVKLVASQQGTTIASILAEMRRLTRRAPRVTLAVSPLSRFQVRDLRFRSVVWTDLDACVSTTLPAGMWATLEALRADHALGRASR